jgi:hypothetical protein
MKWNETRASVGGEWGAGPAEVNGPAAGRAAMPSMAAGNAGAKRSLG